MAVDFFLKLDGINGEAMDENHKNEIRLLSWSWGANQVTSVSGSGGSGAGKASLSDMSIMKDFDAASPLIYKALLMGTHIKTATLTASKSSGSATGTPFLKIDLGEVFVTSQQLSGSSEIPTESISFSYNTIKIDYSKQNETGNLTSTGAVTYDLKANKVS
ncbi:Hcp family type VI secretion system effector [Granulicella paludicola]|uniref:Hcp family type VI secretion system effector n=1 Tax=Granulicella paludicola TaxID=474951 RepID=UPI0021E0159A|nr:type VI secretion system tube protein Hcp [Granulicella paludicola]